MYIYIYIHSYIHTYIYIHIYIYINTYACIRHATKKCSRNQCNIGFDTVVLVKNKSNILVIQGMVIQTWVGL